MVLTRLFFFFLSLSLCLGVVPVVNTSAQHTLFDTVYIDFNPDTILKLRQVCVSKISDSRNEHPGFLRYVEEKKYLMVPADKEIYTRQAIATEISAGLCSNHEAKRSYWLDIKKFEIIVKKSKFGTQSYLVADLDLYDETADSAKLLGTFYYDYPYVSEKKKETAEEQSTNILEHWHRDFKLDLLTFNATSAEGDKELSKNFISDPSVRSVYLNSRGSALLGYDWWGFQGELFFSRPETQSSDRYTNGIIRYLNNTDYESFAIGRSAEHFWWRRNNSWILDVDLNMLLGFCRWKDIEVHNPKIHQLFDFSLSSAQSIQYNPKNQRTLTFRAGLFENISYIIEKKPKLLLGIQLGIGIKI